MKWRVVQLANQKYPKYVITVANGELGYLEKQSGRELDDKTKNAGSGNYTKYWRDIYPAFQGEAWCNAFVNWCFVVAYGEAAAKELLCTAGSWSFYTPTSAQYFQNKKQWHTADPQVGDVIFFKNSTRIHHVGIVYKTNDKYVFTIEGNTSSGDDQVIPNGGGVFAKSYLKTNKNIAGYGRPNYEVEIEVGGYEIPLTTGRAGVKIVGAERLNVRKSPAVGAVIKTYALGDHVQCFGKVMTSDGAYWFKTDDGYISGKYIEGWIKEANNRWWYVQKGYTYPVSKVIEIEGQEFAFDRDGWNITSDRINSDGSIVYN